MGRGLTMGQLVERLQIRVNLKRAVEGKSFPGRGGILAARFPARLTEPVPNPAYTALNLGQKALHLRRLEGTQGLDLDVAQFREA